MARKRKSTPWGDAPIDSVPESDDGGELAANPQAPAEHILQRSGRLRRFATYALVFGGIPAMLLTSWSMLTSDDQVNPSQYKSTSIEVNDSLGKSAAVSELNRWMAADPSPLPGGKILSWDGYKTTKRGKAKSDSQRPAEAGEIHYFTLSTTSGSNVLYYTATVYVEVDKTLGALVVGTPSLMPRPEDATSGWSNQAWAGYDSATASDAVSDAVSAWARAYTSSAADLRLNVGDENENHSYAPLIGATVVDVDVTDAGVKSTADDKSNASEILVRATVSFTWGQVAGNGTSRPSTMTFDLLVQKANTASPHVVAWGGVGTGPSLKPYQNAVVGKSITEKAPDTATQAPVSQGE